MTSYEYNVLDNMIDDYSKTHRFDSVTKLMPEITDKTVLEFLDILPKYSDAEKIIANLKYIRDEVVECDCEQCIENEKEATEQENKTINEQDN